MQRPWKKILACSLASQLVSLGLSAQSAVTASHPPTARAVLVELFTSEGCSSCPPADALLKEIDGAHTQAGQLIVGISEHVTYWNHLGWSDPFSSALFTDRQNGYGDRFRLDSVYTPQIVINGTEQIVGNDRSGLLKALDKELASPTGVSLHILSTTVMGDTVKVRFSATDVAPTTKGDIFAALVDDLDQSNVLRGENSGRNLPHVSVARMLTRVAPLRAVGDQEVKVHLPPAFQPSQKHHLILFAQAPSYGHVMAIDTSPLPAAQ